MPQCTTCADTTSPAGTIRLVGHQQASVNAYQQQQQQQESRFWDTLEANHCSIFWSGHQNRPMQRPAPQAKPSEQLPLTQRPVVRPQKLVSNKRALVRNSFTAQLQHLDHMLAPARVNAVLLIATLRYAECL